MRLIVLPFIVCFSVTACQEQENTGNAGGNQQDGSPAQAPTTGGSPVLSEEPVTIKGGKISSLQGILDALPATAIPRAENDPARWDALSKEMAKQLNGKEISLNLKPEVWLRSFRENEGTKFYLKYKSGIGPGGGPGAIKATTLERDWLKLAVLVRAFDSQALTAEQADRIFGEPNHVKIKTYVQGTVVSAWVDDYNKGLLFLQLKDPEIPNIDTHLDEVVAARNEVMTRKREASDAEQVELAADVKAFTDDFYKWLMPLVNSKKREGVIKFVREVAGVDKMDRIGAGSVIDRAGEAHGVADYLNSYDTREHDLKSTQFHTALKRRGADLSVMLDHPSFEIISDETKLKAFVEKRDAELARKHGYSYDNIKGRTRGE